MTIKNDNKSLFEYRLPPVKQAGIVFVVGLIFMGFSTLFPMSPEMKMAKAMPWVIALAMILFFGLVNCVFALATDNGQKYWSQSIISYASLAVSLCLIAWAISGVAMDDAGSIRWILTVFTFGYLVLLSIVNLIRFFVWIAERSDAKKKDAENK